MCCVESLIRASKGSSVSPLFAQEPCQHGGENVLLICQKDAGLDALTRYHQTPPNDSETGRFAATEAKNSSWKGGTLKQGYSALQFVSILYRT